MLLGAAELFYSLISSAPGSRYLHILTNTRYFLFCLFLTMVILTDLSYYLIVVLNCISFMVSDVDHKYWPFICLFKLFADF